MLNWLMKTLALKTIVRAVSAGLVALLLSRMPWWVSVPGLALLLYWIFS